MHSQKDHCQELRISLAEIRAIKEKFDIALEEGKRRGNILEARQLCEELETKFFALHELWSPFERELSVREQYTFQVEMLKKLGLVKELSSGVFGIRAVDAKEYPLPTLSEVNRRMVEKREILREKIPQGFTKLCIVPFGLDIQQLIGAYKKVILEHYARGKLFATKEDPGDPDVPLELKTSEPIFVEEEVKQGNVYYPKMYDGENYGGESKEELLKENNGFEIKLMEDLPNIPRKGKGITRGGRPQLTPEIDTGSTDAYTVKMREVMKSSRSIPTPNEYRRFFRENPVVVYQHESLVTLEDTLIYAMTHLEYTNQVVDDHEGKGSVSYQLGSYMRREGVLIAVSWEREGKQTMVEVYGDDRLFVSTGVRSSVSL